MSLLELSPELLLHIASYLSHVQLLNVSLVCKHLHAVIEPELYREYNNPRLYSRSFIPFIKKLIDRPELAKHVRQVDLHPWDTLDIFQPDVNNQTETSEFEHLRSKELSEDDYGLLTRAAQAAGVIETVDPYEPTSRLIDLAESLSSANEETDPLFPWYEHFFHDTLRYDEVTYDTKFCQLLRAGVEDPQAVLILAMLPNLQKILLRGGPQGIHALAWRTHHHFGSLRELLIYGTSDVLTWPMAFFDPILATAPKLEVFQAYLGSSWWRDIFDSEYRETDAIPLTLLPGSLPHVHTLDLKRCCLKIQDLQSLILACPGLKSFYYYAGGPEQGPYDPSPACIIGLLEPLKNTLEKLYLEVGLDVSEDGIPGELCPRLESLAHCTALQILDTSAELWESLVEEDLDVDGFDIFPDMPESFRLRHRLPPNLRTLIFHASDERVEPSLSQISDLVQMRPDVLPNLQELYVGTEDEDYIYRFEQMLLSKHSRVNAGRHPLVAQVGIGKLVTVFDRVVRALYLPDVKWFGHKYSARRRKPTLVHKALDKIIERRENGNTAESIMEVLEDEPELQAALNPKKTKDEPVEYFDSDYESDEELMEKNLERGWAMFD